MGATYKFSYQDIVTFDTVAVQGFGIVLGIASVAQQFIGVRYIIQVIESSNGIPNEEYPFGAIIIDENNLSKHVVTN